MLLALTLAACSNVVRPDFATGGVRTDPPPPASGYAGTGNGDSGPTDTGGPVDTGGVVDTGGCDASALTFAASTRDDGDNPVDAFGLGDTVHVVGTLANPCSDEIVFRGGCAVASWTVEGSDGVARTLAGDCDSTTITSLSGGEAMEAEWSLTTLDPDGYTATLVAGAGDRTSVVSFTVQ